MSEQAPITLVAPDGQRFDVPHTGVEQLRKKGFRDLTDAERHDAELQKKYGEGVLPAVGAGVSGAASALTFGASDALLAQTPLAEANRESVERNPTAHTVGQVTALAAPIVGELGAASAAARAAKAGAGAVAEIGAGTRAAQLAGAGITGVGKGSAALGEVASAIVPKAVAPIVRGATQAATEGAAFQVGANVGEASRRDVPLDAETLLAHVGEAGVLGGGLGSALPIAGKVARWSADKAVAGLEKGVQGLRELGVGVADAAVDAAERGAGAIVRNADNIGAAVEGAGNKVANAVDEHLLPKIRQGLTEQTGRPDIINDVFATGAEGQALRKELGPQTITGTREVQAEALNKPLNEIWEASLSNEPLFNDIGIAVKRDTQALQLQRPLAPKVHSAVVRDVIGQAGELLTTLEANSPKGAELFREELKNFTRAAKAGSGADLYQGIDDLKALAGKLAKLDGKRAMFDSGAGLASEAANDFRGFAQRHLENTEIWGHAGVVQHEVNAAYTQYKRAFDKFEAFFAPKRVKNQPVRVLDGAKIEKWAKDITGPAGEVKNAVVDDLVESQQQLIALTDRLSKQAQQQARATLGSQTTGEVARARAAAIEAAPEGISDILSRSLGHADKLAAAKATATKTLDRAEVLQQTQSAILSRQGAGVNPLPVALATGIGGGALVGGMVGGLPGALVGGGLTSVLQKYGAITSNPKSAIEFLNTIDHLRGVDKERVSLWIKATLGEATDALPAVRGAITTANKAAARRILEARGTAERGVESLASRLDTASPGLMRRILPAVSYADVTNSTPDEWWKRTQKTIAGAQANPQKLVEQAQKDVAGIADTLPDLAKAVSGQQLRVLGYLADRMPRNPRPYMLGGSAWTPDPSELKEFRDVVLVATKPDALLPLITIGTASRAQVDAVRELWPRKFEETKQQVISAVMAAASDGKPVAYEARIRLGQLLGVPLDPSQEPGFSQWLDSTQGAQPPPGSPPPQSNAPQGINLNLNTKNQLPQSLQRAAGQ